MWADEKLSKKVQHACRVARENGYRYLWIDSCCIDKASSSELSESINSMYQWYAHSSVCFAFLPDVPANENHQADGSHFRCSRWFTRGWTLQELIAPVNVVFLAKDWSVIASKQSHANLVGEITNIDYNALLQVEPLDQFSIAQRLSWASNRKTTRVEDQAYSLLGIFDINMPTLYGEGERAFRRLQEEIMHRIPDQSLFAWTNYKLPTPSSYRDYAETERDVENKRPFMFSGAIPKSLLAPSPSVFKECARIEALHHHEVLRRLQLPANSLPPTDYDFTPYGIRLKLPVIPFASSEYFPRQTVYNVPNIPPLSQWCLVILGCGHMDFPEHLIGRVCSTRSSGASIEFFYHGNVWYHFLAMFDLLLVSPQTIMRIRSHISWTRLYVTQPKRDPDMNFDVLSHIQHETIKLILPKKTHDALSGQGYMTTLCRVPDSTTHLVTLTHDTHTILIEYQHTLQAHQSGQELTVKVVVKISMAGLQNTPGDLGVSQVKERSITAYMPWRRYLDIGDVDLNIPGFAESKLQVYLSLATRSHYFLNIEVGDSDKQSQIVEL